MMRSSLALLTSLFFAPVAASAQSVARLKQVTTPQPGIENSVTDEMTAAARSIVALKRLEKDVLVYRSLGDFEGNGKLARVSYQAFRNDLNEVTAEVEAQLARLPESRLKAELGNRLAVFRSLYGGNSLAPGRQVLEERRAFDERSETACSSGRLNRSLESTSSPDQPPLPQAVLTSRVSK